MVNRIRLGNSTTSPPRDPRAQSVGHGCSFDVSIRDVPNMHCIRRGMLDWLVHMPYRPNLCSLPLQVGGHMHLRRDTELRAVRRRESLLSAVDQLASRRSGHWVKRLTMSTCTRPQIGSAAILIPSSGSTTAKPPMLTPASSCSTRPPIVSPPMFHRSEPHALLL